MRNNRVLAAVVCIFVVGVAIKLATGSKTKAEQRTADAKAVIRAFVQDTAASHFEGACALVVAAATIRSRPGGCEGVLRRQRGVSYWPAAKSPLTLTSEGYSGGDLVFTASYEGAGFDSGGPGDTYSVSFPRGRAKISGLNGLF